MNKTVGSVMDEGARGAIETSIRNIAAKLLESGEIDVFIGYEEGTLPLRTTPAFISHPEDAARLVWGPTCENNLTVYLPEFQGTVGVVVKSCDVRALVNLILENQICRDKVKIIGIPCSGIIARDRVRKALGHDRIIRNAKVTERSLVLKGDGFEVEMEIRDVLAPSCEVCSYPVPLVYDVLVGDESMARSAKDPEAGYLEVEKFAKLPPDARFSYFAHEIEGCIQCYACRQVCPLCYCNECFADRQSPKWISRWRGLSDKMLFHLGRALHTAGRCVDCGACRRACPVGIDLRLLTKNMEKVAKESFEYESGLDIGGLPLLATYRRDDPDGFIL
ncbi:MAG: 4Fe-4S ferredoxin [Firmicutes bacterium]|jgi:formate dehydrogenase subunit beta|nr:4Fe-4S ferredoxin [Bacillota bacterium]HXL04795.1 4Fe-4S dicluster domain-containing protein [Bacillota bacterium]